MIRPNRTWRAAAVLAAAALVLTACGSYDTIPSDKKSDGGSSSSAKKGDGTLTIGTLLPQTGDLAFLGPPEFAGVDLPSTTSTPPAASTASRSSRSRPTPVTARPTSRAPRPTSCSTQNADVIVGAASSSVSLSVIDKITGAGVVQFSPANTSPALRRPTTDRRASTSAPPRPTSSRARSWPTSRRGRQQERRDPGPPGLLRRGPRRADRRRTSRPVAATSSTKVLYYADAENFTAEVNKVAAPKPDAIVLVAFDETKKIIPQLIAKGVGPQDIKIYFVDGNTGRLLRRTSSRAPHGRQGHPPGCRARPGLQGAAAEDRPEAQGLHLRSRVLRRRRCSPRWRRSRPRTTAASRSRREIIKVSKDGTAVHGLQGVRRAGQERRGHRLRRCLRSRST